MLVSSSVEDDGGLVQRVGTLRDALKEPASPLLLTCYRVLLDKEGKIAYKVVNAIPDARDPEEYRKVIRGESAKFANIIKEAGITVD